MPVVVQRYPRRRFSILSLSFSNLIGEYIMISLALEKPTKMLAGEMYQASDAQTTPMHLRTKMLNRGHVF